MKRKRGHKKGKKSKKSKSVTEQGDLIESNENAETQTSEQSSEGPAECENSEHDESTRMEVDAPSSTGSGNSPVAASVDPAAKPVARVKVKLKTSKAPEPDETLRDVGNDKSISQAVSVKPDEKKEELVPGLPERRPVFLNVYRKTKGIKIKTSKALDGSSSVTEKPADAVKVQDAVVLEKETKTPDEKPQASKNEPEKTPISLQKEEKKTDLNSRYNKQEVEDSLTVIKKIMKMDAADPFNAPVNPEALGIPDYFDIIKTPMDFGTICNNFEKGNKYMNSEDVYKDVQYIWNNCSKYNKKGDYIVDLMKRVKKNFMKYWTAAGLYTEQSAGENTDDGGKTSTKGSQSKQKSHKRHGRHHKSDCMCAVCVLKRRKRERERDTQGHSGIQEESSPVGSPSVGNSSINMGDEQDMDTDVDNKTEQEKTEIVELDSPVSEKQRVTESKQEVEEEEEENVEVESENKTEANVEDKTQSIDRSMEETGDEPVTSTAEKLVALASVVGPKSSQNEEEEKEKQLQEQKELERKEWRMKMQEKFEVRNPQLLSLCETLFPNDNNHTSVWNGPHSLFKRRGGPNRSSALHKAVEALMK
ncbi:PREDICTED: bromodomain-containing protein 4A-like isoform X2 [Camelina sativa]|uniref:Bromodomain-containing protein 4A-like isoform X2 n=1 Tax=Camelina sativa TaxID=90675 RepID=A0ABM0Z758_CAMSA|nr:PREDICTED: bromodomain-containing protein 4A-like isoform X2 [Camelina sativa]